jgi:hypothetical protein
VVFGMVACALLAFVTVSLFLEGGGPKRPKTSDLAGLDDRRLPKEVDAVWSTVLPGTGGARSSSVIVEGRDLVVAVVNDGSRNRSMIAGVDAFSGNVRWTRSSPFAPSEISTLDVIEGSVVIEQLDPLGSNRILGLSTVDGTTLWERRFPSRSVNAVLAGTGLVANIVAGDLPTTTFFDPRTGEQVGEILGQIASTDLDGGWLFSDRGDLLTVDLASGWSAPTDSGNVGSGRGVAMAVVGGRIVVADPLGGLTELRANGDELASPALDDLPRISAMWPAGGSSVVAVGDGEVFGVELLGRGARVTWRRQATLRSFSMSERGLLVALGAASGGPDTGNVDIVVDGVTGVRLAGPLALGGAGRAPVIVADGFIVENGEERVARDLDGDEIWRLGTPGKIAVGDELIVVLNDTPAGFELTAYGAV